MWLDAVDTQRHAWHVFDVWCGCTYSTAIPCSVGLSSIRDCRWKNSHLPRRRFQCFPISSSVVPSRYSRTMTGFSNREAYSTARCEAFSISSSMASCHRLHTRPRGSTHIVVSIGLQHWLVSVGEVSDATTIHEQRVNGCLVSEGTAHQKFRFTHAEPDGCHIVICGRI